MKEKRNSASLFGLFMENYLSDDEEESSDESFRVEDHTEQSDLSNEDDEDDDSSDEDESDESGDDEAKKQKNADTTSKTGVTTISAVEKLAEQTKSSSNVTEKLLATPICCACLSDRSDDSNEIVTCDSCKITVHEGCYGVSDSASISSTVSSCSTEPWFCEPCKANIKNPDCELCPNKGGIFKETDCGKWVHLVCALYVPGVAFGEVDQLSSVTLFEMQYNKWGAKTCSLCENDHFARTGVCIGCDAGLCKNYFHVTCAQREGLLSEAHHEEVDQADPFYAHCRVHSDKFLIKHRKKNYNALVMQMKRHEALAELAITQKPTEEQERIERKLKNQRIKYATHKMNRPEPWVPTQKMSRALITSASAVKKLMKKAELMEIDSAALEFQEAQIASLTDIRKKWHIPPAFSTEFVGYYLDRTIRMREMKANLEQQVESNKSLLEQQSILRVKYDDAIKVNQEVQHKQKDLILEIEQLHNAILAISPNKQLQNLEMIGKPANPVKNHSATATTTSTNNIPTLSSTPPPQLITSRVMSVPTAAALKQGVGFPLNNLRKDDTGRILSTQCPSNMSTSNDELLNECGTCKKCHDQHLLAKCDTCHLYYHLGCLNPPLTRHPKKAKNYVWQCSECDKSDHSDDQNALVIPKGPRKSRNVRYSKEGIFPADLHDSFGSEKSLNNFSLPSSPIRIPNGADEVIDLSTLSSKELLPSLPLPELPSTAEINLTEKIIEKPVFKKKRRESIVITKLPKSAKRGRKIKKEESQELTQEVVKIEEPPESQNSIPLPLASPPSSSSHETKPKRGRPKKSNEQPQTSPEMPTKETVLESSLLDLSQYRAFANIPNSIPTESLTTITPVTDNQSDLVTTNGIKMMNGDGSYLMASGSHHKHKKRKSHKRRHSHSPSSADRQSTSSGKKHKRKHKHKDYEMPSESDLRPANDDQSSIEQPRIKIKFRAILQNSGDDKKPPKFMWHVPNENNEFPADFPQQHQMENGHQNHITHANGNGKKRKSQTSSTKAKKIPRLLMSTEQLDSDIIAQPASVDLTSSSTSLLNRSLPLPDEICDVCNNVGSSQNLVKCDECLKNYHFHCLLPPLKKTPKKRGYSWICADCDPTDHENN